MIYILRRKIQDQGRTDFEELKCVADRSVKKKKKERKIKKKTIAVFQSKYGQKCLNFVYIAEEKSIGIINLAYMGSI